VTQRDGHNVLCALANTDKGLIPGKAKGDTCWYSYGGKEHLTNSFSLVSGCFVANPEHKGRAPGRQHDSGEYWCAVANGPHGPIPGKARGDTCWYPYGGSEHLTKNFKFVRVVTGNKVTCQQRDGASTFCAIAITSSGDRIPGKANGDTCWYSYGGVEHLTNNFVNVTGEVVEHECLKGSASGHQADSGDYWNAIANGPHGKIAGKARGDTCWYPYGGAEHSTKNFQWVHSV